MEYDNSNRGSIWPNRKKEKDTQPDFTGSLDVGGVQYWVSAWRKKEGAPEKQPSLTFSIKPKDEFAAAPASTPGVPADEDDIPF